MEIPKWSEELKDGDALSRFIYENEPAGEHYTIAFRTGLQEAISEIRCTTEERLQARVQELERENERLRDQLETAQSQINVLHEAMWLDTGEEG